MSKLNYNTVTDMSIDCWCLWHHTGEVTIILIVNLIIIMNWIILTELNSHVGRGQTTLLPRWSWGTEFHITNDTAHYSRPLNRTEHLRVEVHQRGPSQANISKQAWVLKCTAQALLKKHKEMGSVGDHRCSVRSTKCSAADERRFLFTSVWNPKMSSCDIITKLTHTHTKNGWKVHQSDMWRQLTTGLIHLKCNQKSIPLTEKQCW